MNIRITPQNASRFPAGTRVRFFYGCPVSTGADWDGVQEEDGIVTGWRSTEWATELEIETEHGERKWVGILSDAGIGCRLLGENE